MPTISIKSELTIATDKDRINLIDIYKSYSSDSVSINNISIDIDDSYVLDTSNSEFAIIIPDDYNLDNANITLVLDNGTDTFELTNISYFMSNTFSLEFITIMNKGEQTMNLTIVN